MTFEIERAARMKTELLTARLPSCAAALAASSLTNNKYESCRHPLPSGSYQMDPGLTFCWVSGAINSKTWPSLSAGWCWSRSSMAWVSWA